MFGGKKAPKVCVKCQLYELERKQSRVIREQQVALLQQLRAESQNKDSTIAMLRDLVAEAMESRRPVVRAEEEGAPEEGSSLERAAARMRATNEEELAEAADGETSELQERITEVHLDGWDPPEGMVGDPMTADIFSTPAAQEESGAAETETLKDGDG